MDLKDIAAKLAAAREVRPTMGPQNNVRIATFKFATALEAESLDLTFPYGESYPFVEVRFEYVPYDGVPILVAIDKKGQADPGSANANLEPISIQADMEQASHPGELGAERLDKVYLKAAARLFAAAKSVK